VQYEVYYQVEKPILNNLNLDENSLLPNNSYARFSITGSTIKPTAALKLDDDSQGINIININKNNVVFDILFSRLESEGNKQFTIINDIDPQGYDSIIFIPTPIIKNISPSSGIQYFANNQLSFESYFSKHNASISVGSSSNITPTFFGNIANFILPELEIDTLGLKDIYLNTSAGLSNKLLYETLYSIVTPVPTSVSVVTSSLSEEGTHASLDISGTLFKPVANVEIDDIPAAIISQNKTSIRISAPFTALETSGNKTIKVINDYAQLGSGSISWTPVPIIFDLSETSGSQYFANNILVLTRYFSTSSLTITFGSTTNIEPTNIYGRRFIFDIGNMNKIN
jgi:hypothetical protein